MPNFLVLANPWKSKSAPSDQIWLYEVVAEGASEAGAIAMRCAEIGAQLDGLIAPTRVLVENADSERAKTWEGEYDTWPAEYCADIAARYGVAKEAGRR
jgi:hypothetical protein